MQIVRLQSQILRAGSLIMDILAPRHCELCGSPMNEHSQRFEFLCAVCADSLSPAPPPDELFNRLFEHFHQDDIALSGVFSLFLHSDEPPVFRLLYALKYEARSRIGTELGAELGASLRHLGRDSYDALVPVPIHPARRRFRGYNQSDMIAEGVNKELIIPVQTEWIRRNKHTPSQTTLHADERRQNVSGAFTKGKRSADIRNKRILLLDDVFTTGATLNACATALLEFGAKQVDAATLVAA